MVGMRVYTETYLYNMIYNIVCGIYTHIQYSHSILSWIECLLPAAPNSYGEALTSSVAALGDESSKEVIKVK